MEIDTGDDVLGKAALDGSMDYSAWPRLLPSVLARIEKIAHTEFPIPAVPPRQPARPPSPRFLAPLPSSDPFEAPDQADSPSSQGTNKENADPSLPPATGNAATSTSAAPAVPSAPTLPKPIADMLDEILSVLRANFPQYPPHTIQRLSELVLRPRQHYRNLVPYLHALDRVVHVTSGANAYPLPPALPDVAAMSLFANGVSAAATGRLSIDTAAANSVASDEALGGALLTPIPWLTRRANGGGSDDGSDAGSSSPLSADGNNNHNNNNNNNNPAQQFQLQQQQQRQGAGHLEGRVRTESTETIEGPNGIGSIETVSVSVNGVPSTGAGFALLTQRSVTQGELLRQEQRAGLVPMSQLNRQQQQQAQGGAPAEEEDATMAEDTAAPAETEAEIPHARGPDEIGPADTGPQSAETVNIIAGGGGASPMDAQAIDVEAAVGRRVQSPPAASGSPSGGSDIIPRSPKREAADHLEPELPAKRRKDDDGDDDETSKQDQTNTTQEDDTIPSAQGAAASDAPKPDAEGDLDLPDATTQPTDPVVDEASNPEPEPTSAMAVDQDNPDTEETTKGKDSEGAAQEKGEQDGNATSDPTIGPPSSS